MKYVGNIKVIGVISRKGDIHGVVFDKISGEFALDLGFVLTRAGGDQTWLVQSFGFLNLINPRETPTRRLISVRSIGHKEAPTENEVLSVFQL